MIHHNFMMTEKKADILMTMKSEQFQDILKNAYSEQTEPPELSIVIPCLNEEITLGKTIEIAWEAIKLSQMNGEVVIADNGSTDKSVAIAESMNCRVVKAEEKGYGYALQHGIKESWGKYIIIGDADATYDFREAVPFVKNLEKGTELILGNRIGGEIQRQAMPFLHRYLGTPVLTYLINLFFKTCITDVNCGLRGFTREAVEKLQLISGGMEFSSEMIIKAGIYRLNIAEFPCSLHDDDENREPHLKTWRDGWRHLRLILLFAPHIVFALPGWISLFLGLLITVLVLPGPFHAFGIYMDYHYLFYSIPLIILGYQALWFETFNKCFIRFSGYLSEDYPSEESLFFSFPKWSLGAGNIEIWLLFGFFLFLSGAGALGWIFAKWVATSFGSLSHVRLGIAGMMLMICGLQTVMNALMISMMSIKVHK